MLAVCCVLAGPFFFALFLNLFLGSHYSVDVQKRYSTEKKTNNMGEAAAAAKKNLFFPHFIDRHKNILRTFNLWLFFHFLWYFFSLLFGILLLITLASFLSFLFFLSLLLFLIYFLLISIFFFLFHELLLISWIFSISFFLFLQLLFKIFFFFAL